jgi:hypothetical protein
MNLKASTQVVAPQWKEPGKYFPGSFRIRSLALVSIGVVRPEGSLSASAIRQCRF